jgi:predicted metal-dependent hydrolase
LRLRADGVARVTIPRRGSISAARNFALKNIGWLERQFQLQADQPKTPMLWGLGTEIYFRGELVLIEVVGGKIRFGSEQIKVSVSVNERSKPASRERMKTSHFEGRIALGATDVAQRRDESTQRELATFDNDLGGAWLVPPADCA